MGCFEQFRRDRDTRFVMTVPPAHTDLSDTATPTRLATIRRLATHWIAILGLAVGLLLSAGSAAHAAVPAAPSDPYADAYIARVCAIRGASTLIKVCSQRERRTIYHVRVTRCVASHLIAAMSPSVWS